MRTLVLGDIHGAAAALQQVLDRSNFDPASDRVVFLGDAVDGWPETDKVLDLLLTIPDLVYVIGNHDVWFQDWYLGKWHSIWDMRLWTDQGGRATQDAYGGDSTNVPQAHRDLLDNAVDWYVQDGCIFVHGGWSYGVYDHPKHIDPEFVREHVTWERVLWKDAYRRAKQAQKGEDPEPLTRWKEVYVGHTSTSSLKNGHIPVQACEVWNMDQGCGWYGRLSIMDVETKQFWQSDLVQDLYPDHVGR